MRSGRGGLRRRPRSIASLLLVCLACISSGDRLLAQGRGSDTDDPGYRALQAAVEAAFPGATVDFDEATVTYSDGTSDRIEMGCYREDLLEGRRTVTLSFQFPERTRAAVEKSTSVAEAVAGGRAPRIGIVTLDAEGEPVEARLAFLEPGGQLANCLSMGSMRAPLSAATYGELLEQAGDATGPFMETELSALYEHAGGLASMLWGRSFDVGEARYRILWPVTVSLESGEMELFRPEALEPGVVRVRGVNTGRTFTYRCPDTDACIVPAEEVLSWVSGG